MPHLARAKRKRVFKHAQNAQVQSSRVCAMSHPGKCSPPIHSAVSIDSRNGQRRPWSDCADAQADLDLRCPHIPEDTFSHGSVCLEFCSLFILPVQLWKHYNDSKISSKCSWPWEVTLTKHCLRKAQEEEVKDIDKTQRHSWITDIQIKNNYKRGHKHPAGTWRL